MNKKLNPLDILGLRVVPFFTPDHFYTATVNYDHRLTHWINEQLAGRYFLQVDYSQRIGTVVHLGFEDPKELTMLMLACPYIHTN